MANLVEHFIQEPGPCPYLADRSWQLESRLMLDVTPEELEHLLVRGWRRFGPDYFRPVCGDCLACVSLRVPVADFQASKSQRRVLKTNRDLQIRVERPKVTPERLSLYERWHRNREDRHGWPESTINKEIYGMQFCFPHPCAWEMTYYLDERLVAVGFVDRTPMALSSVYFFHDPDLAPRSPGTASLLFEIELARRQGIPHVYLGYRVSGCQSLEYKDRFRPNEALVGRPGLEESPEWRLEKPAR